MANFTDKRVVITGASGGVGRALCRYFHEHGATLIALDKAVSVRELADARTDCAVVDLSDSRQVETTMAKMIEKHGVVDVLVNNVGIGSERTVAGTTVEGWQRVMDVDLNSVFYCTSAVLPQMQQKGSGSVVMISSVNGLSFFGSPAYSATKAAMISFAKSIAVEYGPYGVRANTVCPGTVRTPIWQDRLEKNPALFDELGKWYPLGRIAEPDDVAKAVGFLASDDASYITGAVLNVDGGLLAGNAVMASEIAQTNRPGT